MRSHVHEVAYPQYGATCEACGAVADAWCSTLGHRCATCFVRDEEASHLPTDAGAAASDATQLAAPVTTST